MSFMGLHTCWRYASPSFRHYSLPKGSFYSISTLTPSSSNENGPLPESHSDQQPQIDESHILNQLSDILPVHDNQSVHNPPIGNLMDNHLQTRAVDGFLQPEDKLRGVFLQKLCSKSAIESTLTNVYVELTIDILAKVVNRGSLDGEAMVTFFNWAVKQPNISKDLDSYHVILKALGRRKYFKHMVDMLCDMSKWGIIPTSETLFIVMDSFIRARQVSKAIQIFYNLEDYALERGSETFNILLRCLCQRSHVGTACSLLNKMKGKVPFNSMTYNLVIGGWSKFGRISEVERNLEAMVEIGLDPDSLTYSYILEGLGRAEQIDDAVKIFRELEEMGCMLTAEVYNAMISNFTSVGNIDEGLIYYNQMLRSNCSPNMDTYIRLISALLKVRRVAEAIELYDEMLNRGIVPTTGVVTSFMEPLCGYGPPHAALIIYKKARKVGCKVSMTTYKLLLLRLSRLGKCGMLFDIWAQMQDSGYSSDTEVFEYIINGLCSIGKLENAVLVMEESLQMGFCPSRLTCSKLNKKLLASNKVEMAYKLLLKIKVARKYENARTYWRAKGWHF
ncbi:hypothetical protein M9H77_19919 [Catharanthus roseus]|uniref:Uncharacterized protein n=1 Tax=Catharanthus roseus TaxID=4058 RepID=A0ACC0AIP1_CATRO|nr:hypothetical protein M9H77_19919 [Catharanthus roseus]